MEILYAFQRRGTIMVHSLHHGMCDKLQRGPLKFNIQEKEFFFLLHKDLLRFRFHAMQQCQ